ncbi:MAG: hypothetical protein RJA51_1153, partial [Actinomycetota bacterium]
MAGSSTRCRSHETVATLLATSTPLLHRSTTRWTVTLSTICYQPDEAQDDVNEGPQKDNYANAIAPGTATGTTIDLSAAAFQNVTSDITFRLYAWRSGNSGTNAQFAIQNFQFTGTVDSAPIDITQQPSTVPNDVCLNGSLPFLTVAASGVGTPSYQWYYSTTGNNYGGIAIPGANNSSYTIPTNVATSRFYYCRITYGSCTIFSECSGRNIVSNGPVILVQPSSGTPIYKCEGDIYILSVVSNSINVTYQWYSRTSSNGTGTLIPGATNSFYQVPTNVSSSLFYYCQLTNACGTVNSNTSRRVRVTVMSTKPSTNPQDVCINSAVAPITVGMSG